MKKLALFKLINEDLKLIEQELQKVVKNKDPLLSEASAHLLKAGGKRLRPAFALLAGKTTGRKSGKLVPLAMALELIHMASLVHDDVIDDSYTRRGIPTVKANWGDQISIYTGSYLFAEALALVSELNDPAISRIVSNICTKMCEGEIEQIRSSFQPEQGVKDYFFRIKRKTALLISASCELGATACDAQPQNVRLLTRYGHYLGMAFQITDDILDLTANQKQLGKPVGSDLRQGIITLPAIFALELSTENEILTEILRKRHKNEGEVQEAIKIIKGCGAIEKAARLSNKFLMKAKKELGYLPVSKATDSLAYVADYVGQRKN